MTTDPIRPAHDAPPPVMLTEEELAESWNQQADEFNRWDSLDSGEQLAWAQARAIARDRADCLLDPAGGGEALLATAPEGEPSDEQLIDAWNENSEYYALYTEACNFARDVLTRWGRPAALPAPLEGEVRELVAELDVAAVTVESEGGHHEAAAVRRAVTLLQQQAAELATLRSLQGGEVK